MLRTLKETTWEKIEVGEIYCVDHIQIEYKNNNKSLNQVLVLSSDAGFYMCDYSGVFMCKPLKQQKIYKLPKSVQKLFKEE